MDTLLLVDGSNLLFQMFFGMPARISGSDGRAIQGTLGFVGALLKMIRMTRPTHVGILFDGEHENPRAGLDPDYKANRVNYSQAEEQDNPFSQLPDIYKALDFLGICHAETTDCETDDWMAAYARRCGGQMELILASQDSDYFQLISDHVRILRYRGEKTVLWDREQLRRKLGVEPEQYAGFKSLTGDASDNIRGAERVGPKTAAALLGQYGSLERLLCEAETIQKAALRVSILESRERLRRNYELIRLEGICPLPFAPEELRWTDSGIMTNQVLRGIGLR